MLIHDTVIVVTGGANGIGRALCERFAREGARGIVAVDLDPAVEDVAHDFSGVGVRADVSDEDEIRRVVAQTVDRFGRIDLFCSNAGISLAGPLESTSAGDWERMWRVNVMAHVHAARACLPSMLRQGSGYLLQTASAAGLLSQIGSAPYAVTKHAAVALAEWLAITYGDQGIRVSCLCPQGVRTRMLAEAGRTSQGLLDAGAVEPAFVADVVVAGLADERFLILPHPEVAEYFRRKASDYDRWLRGMRRLQQRITPGLPET
jgi:NAD(P)-dependent dehydrogenase (short-subunit alcohol dehydrogenase family)